MGAAPDEPDLDIEAWEKQPNEPGRAYAVFVEFLEAKSLREAVARAWKQDGREPAARVPGHLSRIARKWRWTERKSAFLADRAGKEAAIFQETRLARRRRRLAALDRAGTAISERLEKMDLRKTPPAKVLELLTKIHADEREELLDRAEDRTKDRAGEDRPDVGLPSIFDRIKAPEAE